MGNSIIENSTHSIQYENLEIWVTHGKRNPYEVYQELLQKCVRAKEIVQLLDSGTMVSQHLSKISLFICS